MRYFYIPEVIIQSGVAKTPIETSGETVGELLMLMMKGAISRSALALFFSVSLVQSYAFSEPTMSVSSSFSIGEYDWITPIDNPTGGLEFRCAYLVENISPENIDDNNLIQLKILGGSNQGVYYAVDGNCNWDVEILDDYTLFSGNGEYIDVNGNHSFYLYSSQTNGVRSALATAVAAGDIGGTLQFNSVEVFVPVCLRESFVPPADLTNAVKTVAGAEHFLALTSDGTVVAWGDTRDGACAVSVGLSNVVDIAAGRAHSAALLNDGSVVCWGDGAQEVPASVFGAKSIAARENYTVAMMPGTDPTLPDTDFDGANDGVEVAVGTDPLDPNQRAMHWTASASEHGSVSPTNRWVFPDSQLAVSATPETYYQLDGWAGDTSAIVSNGWNSVTVRMTQDVTLAASFVQIVTETLDVPHEWLAGQGFDIETNSAESVAATDHDQDGYTTGQEYILGTSPTNATSALRVALAPPLLDFQTVTGRLYTIDYCDNLFSNDWKTLTHNLPGTGNPLEIIDLENAPNRFYRVKVRMD